MNIPDGGLPPGVIASVAVKVILAGPVPAPRGQPANQCHRLDFSQLEGIPK